jgi:hypothetical protein
MALIDGISRKQLAAEAVGALLDAQTMALDKVFEPRDWPTSPAEFPMILVSAPVDRKVGVFPGQLEFNTTITLVVVGRVMGPTAEEVGRMLETFSGQIEEALMLSERLVRNIQQFVTIETRSVVDATGRNHIGEFGMTLDLAVFQVFGPTEAVPLRQVLSTIPDKTTGGVLVAAGVTVPQTDPKSK